jgi:hypothetical protein
MVPTGDPEVIRRGEGYTLYDAGLYSEQASRERAAASPSEARLQQAQPTRPKQSKGGKGEKGKGKKEKQPSQATLLVTLAGPVELFHTADGEGFATIEIDNHRETHRLKAKGFRRWLCRQFYALTNRTPAAPALQDALAVLEGRAAYDSPERAVAVRIAAYGNSMFLDLACREWQAVEISESGWRVVSNPAIKFVRPRGVLPLPAPVAGGSMELLREFVNVGSEDDWRLLLAWLLAALRPQGPYPVLVLHGEQGSAKSTTARVLRSLVDPNAAALRSEPREPRDLMIAAGNSWLVALDNLSHLPPWLSDALCRLATGGGFATRELYTDNEEIIFDAQRPVIVNGIEELATRSDLLDRSIVLHLPPLPEERCRPEAELWKDFETVRPRILGALLDTMAGAIREMPNVQLPRHPRMADFATWATAAEPALGWERGSFLAAYTGNRAEANDLALDSSVVAPLLRELAEAGRWEGTCSDLLAQLAAEAGDKATRAQSWPKTPRALSGQLRRLAPNLRRAGVAVELYREAGGKRRRMVKVSSNKDANDRPYRPDRPEPREMPGETRDGSGTVGTQTGTVGTVAKTDRPAENAANTGLRDGRDGRDANSPDFYGPDDPDWLAERLPGRGDAWEPGPYEEKF